MRTVVLFTTGLLLCLQEHALAQVDSVQLRYAATITATDLRAYLTVIASDEYEGRETGMKGQKMAARYIREHFEHCGIPPVPDAAAKGITNGYEQSYPLELSQPGGLSLIIAGKPVGFMQEYFYLNERLQEDLRADTIMLAGYGKQDQEEDDYAGWTAKGGVVMVLQDGNEPTKSSDRPPPLSCRKSRAKRKLLRMPELT